MASPILEQLRGDRPDPVLKYDIRETVGKGAFGDVFLVVDRTTKKKHVLKRIRMARQSEWQRNSTYQEIKIVASLSHPFIVPYVESWIHHGHTVNIVYGYAEKGDLGTYITKHRHNKPFEEDQLMMWLAQLLLAMEYMHSKWVLHRDVKSSNIFLTADGDVQLGDFGLATVRDEKDDGKHDQSLVGTPSYMSPELLSQAKYCFKTDVWSLGCVMYELTALKPAFNAFNLHGLVTKIKRSQAPPLPSNYSAEWGTLIKCMLKKDPALRPSVSQLLACPFLQPAVQQARQRMLEIMPDVQQPPAAPATAACTLACLAALTPRSETGPGSGTSPFTTPPPKTVPAVGIWAVATAETMASDTEASAEQDADAESASPPVPAFPDLSSPPVVPVGTLRAAPTAAAAAAKPAGRAVPKLNLAAVVKQDAAAATARGTGRAGQASARRPTARAAAAGAAAQLAAGRNVPRQLLKRQKDAADQLAATAVAAGGIAAADEAGPAGGMTGGTTALLHKRVSPTIVKRETKRRSTEPGVGPATYAGARRMSEPAAAAGVGGGAAGAGDARGTAVAGLQSPAGSASGELAQSADVDPLRDVTSRKEQHRPDSREAATKRSAGGLPPWRPSSMKTGAGANAIGPAGKQPATAAIATGGAADAAPAPGTLTATQRRQRQTTAMRAAASRLVRGQHHKQAAAAAAAAPSSRSAPNPGIPATTATSTGTAVSMPADAAPQRAGPHPLDVPGHSTTMLPKSPASLQVPGLSHARSPSPETPISPLSPPPSDAWYPPSTSNAPMFTFQAGWPASHAPSEASQEPDHEPAQPGTPSRPPARLSNDSETLSLRGPSENGAPMYPLPHYVPAGATALPDGDAAAAAQPGSTPRLFENQLYRRSRGTAETGHSSRATSVGGNSSIGGAAPEPDHPAVAAAACRASSMSDLEPSSIGVFLDPTFQVGYDQTTLGHSSNLQQQQQQQQQQDAAAMPASPSAVGHLPHTSITQLPAHKKGTTAKGRQPTAPIVPSLPLSSAASSAAKGKSSSSSAATRQSTSSVKKTPRTPRSTNGPSLPAPATGRQLNLPTADSQQTPTNSTAQLSPARNGTPGAHGEGMPLPACSAVSSSSQVPVGTPGQGQAMAEADSPAAAVAAATAVAAAPAAAASSTSAYEASPLGAWLAGAVAGSEGNHQHAGLDVQCQSPTCSASKTEEAVSPMVSPIKGVTCARVSAAQGNAGAMGNTERQRLVLLERIVSLSGRLFEQQRWHELASVLSSTQHLNAGAALACLQQLQQQQGQQPAVAGGSSSSGGGSSGDGGSSSAADLGVGSSSQAVDMSMLPGLGTELLLDAQTSLRGTVRYRGPCHWETGVLLKASSLVPVNEARQASFHGNSSHYLVATIVEQR